MKKIILIIAIIAFVGCKEEVPTQNTLYKKYTIAELENDPDWVEVIDIDSVKYCVSNEMKGGFLLNKQDDYIKLLESNKECTVDSLEVNFSKRDVIIFVQSAGRAEWNRKLFKNNKEKKLKYIVEVNGLDGTFSLEWWSEAISIPKIENGFTLDMDSLHVII